MTDLTKLAERVEALTGPDREVDRLILVALGLRIIPFRSDPFSWMSKVGDEWICVERYPKGFMHSGDRYVPRFTESLDAALTLVPKTGFAEINVFNGHADCGASATVWSIYGEEFCEHIEADTPALALTAACLRAIGSKNDD